MVPRITRAMAVVSNPLVAHPAFFAIFPILFLWSQNVEELSVTVNVADLLIPMGISLAASLVSFVLLTLILKDRRKAALITAAFLLLFYSYGHIHDLLVDAQIFGFPRHRYMLLVWFVLYAGSGLFALRLRANLHKLTNGLNVFGLILVIIPLVNIVSYNLFSNEIAEEAVIGSGPSTSGVSANAASNAPASLPDVYYIIPDTYTGLSNLQRTFDFDNRVFLEFLDSRGFFVGANSNTNYYNTGPSLSSSLNMKHLTYLSDLMKGDPRNPTIWPTLMRESEVFQKFRSLGYQVFHSRRNWMALEEQGYSDIYFGCEVRGLEVFNANAFNEALIHTTVLKPILRVTGVLSADVWSRRLCDFTNLEEVIAADGPKFVFAHLAVPHNPFVFGPNGERILTTSSTTSWGVNPIEEYVNQVIFTNKKLQVIIDRILADSGNPPIIIVQGDHGTSHLGDEFSEAAVLERMPILNAYFLPDGGDSLLYDTITPVNTFRVIFNYYFDGDFELLEDRSYFTDVTMGRFGFKDVTDMVSPKAAQEAGK